ncbi:MAG: choice-of-anchor D domain-containing protein [bacterium]|nr:choice-of-anchor D domain-containing protein [bacterium]
MDLPLRPGARAPQELEFDPLGTDAATDGGPAPASPGGPGQRQEYHRRPKTRRGLLFLTLVIVAALLVWLFFPGPPRAELSVDKVDFGTVRVGRETDERVISIKNLGERKFAVKALEFEPAVGEDYRIVEEGCVGRKLATQASCDVRLVFQPQEAGDRSSRLLFVSNDRTGPAVSLAAVAVAPELGLAPSALSFGVVALESEIESREVTLSNVGTATLEFRRIRIEGPAAGDFSRSRRCPSSKLEPGEACSFEIRFEPSVSGPRRANLVVDSDALGSPDTLALEGAGLWEGPPLDPRSAILDLGEQRVGKRGASKSLLFANRTGGPVAVDRTTVSRSTTFEVVEDGCQGRVVASGESCSISVTFLPVEDGNERGVLSLGAAGASEDVEVELRGRGVTPRMQVEVGAVDFKEQRVGFESAPRRVRFLNSGTATLSPQSVSVSGAERADFLLRSNECVGRPLAPGARCAVAVGFNPARSGVRRASLSLDPGFELDTIQVGLTGSGVVSALGVDPERLDFGQVYLGRIEDRGLTLTNEGSARLEIRGLRFEGSDAAAFDLGPMSCPLDTGLAPRASCKVEIGFEPEAAKPHRASLVLEHNGPDSPARVELVGEGRTPAPAFRISTNDLDLGSAPVAGRGEIGTVVISNPGAAWLPLTSISLRGDNAEDFQLVAGSCDGVAALAPSGSCTVGVRLVPGSVGTRRATILVRHGVGSGTATVTLIGRGLAPTE